MQIKIINWYFARLLQILLRVPLLITRLQSLHITRILLRINFNIFNDMYSVTWLGFTLVGVYLVSWFVPTLSPVLSNIWTVPKRLPPWAKVHSGTWSSLCYAFASLLANPALKQAYLGTRERYHLIKNNQARLTRVAFSESWESTRT